VGWDSSFLHKQGRFDLRNLAPPNAAIRPRVVFNGLQDIRLQDDAIPRSIRQSPGKVRVAAKLAEIPGWVERFYPS